MPRISSRTIASLRLTANCTIVFVALWRRCPVLAVLRCPYFDAMIPRVLTSFRLKEPTICTVVLAILIVSERSYRTVSSSFPTVRLRRLRVYDDGRRVLYWGNVAGD